MTDTPQELQLEELRGVIDFAMKHTYSAKDMDITSEGYLNTCLRLFAKDYKVSILNNNSGELCNHYPSKVALLEYPYMENDRIRNERTGLIHDVPKLKELLSKAKFARCRSRFPVPVILYEGKSICRGATISTGVEIYGRFGYDYFTSKGGDAEGNPDADTDSEDNSQWQLFNRFRRLDIKLLKTFKIGYIQDLMVENKKVKFFLNVTSSEKVDKENRYSDFVIMSLPYPGCEFFRDWKDNNFIAENLKFDWSQAYVDAELDLPGDLQPPSGINWKHYKNWDLVLLTQNYLKVILHYIKEGDSGVLIHCISGWDRTPLFISLLRMSLWADGLIHHSLGPIDILFLTIAYDWYLFGHDLPDRVRKGQEVFRFCFNVLKYITSDEFSLAKKKKRQGSHTDPDFVDGVLLEESAEIEAEMMKACSVRGSNSSINSNSSLNSTKSSIDNAPILFNVGSPEEEVTLSSSNGSACLVTSNGSVPRASPSPHRLDGATASRHAAPAQHCATSTSPMAVPAAGGGAGGMRRLSEVRNSSVCGSTESPESLHDESFDVLTDDAKKELNSESPESLHEKSLDVSTDNAKKEPDSCEVQAEITETLHELFVPSPQQEEHSTESPGSSHDESFDVLTDAKKEPDSWQILSGSGSAKNSEGSPKASPKSISSNSRSRHASGEPDHQHEESTRKQRLDAVRKMFMSIYVDLADNPANNRPNGAGGLTSTVFGYISQSVGLKT